MFDYTNNPHSSSTATLLNSSVLYPDCPTTQIKGALACNKAEGGPSALLPPAPPDSNTGAENTRVMLDWLSVTFPLDWKVENVLDFLKMKGWTALPCGRNGYRAGYTLGNMKLYYDGSPDMGVHLVFSGKGCRDLEFYQIFETWPKFLLLLREKGCSFSRLDVACDDFKGYLTRERIEAAIKSDTIVNRFRSWDFRTGGGMHERGRTVGWTYSFGSRKSDTYCRIYDKAGQTGSKESFHWVRCEVEFKNERADALAAWLSGRDTLEGLQAIMLGVMDFKQEDTRVNRSRWRSASWWSEFLGECSKVRLAIDAAVRSVEATAKWIVHTVIPSFALLLQFPERVAQINDALKAAPGRWKYWQKALLPEGFSANWLVEGGFS